MDFRLAIRLHAVRPIALMIGALGIAATSQVSSPLAQGAAGPMPPRGGPSAPAPGGPPGAAGVIPPAAPTAPGTTIMPLPNRTPIGIGSTAPSGPVMQATSGTPISGTSVGLDHEPEGFVASGTTDRSGGVTFSNLKPGQYKVSLRPSSPTQQVRSTVFINDQPQPQARSEALTDGLLIVRFAVSNPGSKVAVKLEAMAGPGTSGPDVNATNKPIPGVDVNVRKCLAHAADGRCTKWQ
jgi:hypothetical protein